LGAVCGLAAGSLGDVVSIPASRDNTMYESSSGFTSNGAGPTFFVGSTATGQIRRGLIRFDVAAAVPAGSTITGVTMSLSMTQTISLDHPVSLHRALKDWGEGTSNAGDPGGMGAPATDDDATWIHTFRPGSFWSVPGGTGAGAGADYVAAASVTIDVGDVFRRYTWGPTAAMVADAQGWLDSPAGNFGWFVIGDETQSTTAKRFGTREHPTAADRPVLDIEFTPPAGVCYANCDGSTIMPVLNVNDFICFQSKYAAGDSYANCDGSTIAPVLNVSDFICFLGAYAAGCS